MTDPIQSLYRGALLGLAVGEARGLLAESGNNGGPAPHDTQTHGPATSTALLLAQSLLDTRGFDAEDQRSRYRAWVRGEGASSPGRTLSASLAEQTAESAAATADSEDAAALARTAPLAMNILHDAARAKFLAADMSRVSHVSRESADACRYLTGLLVGALRGESQDALLGDLYSPVYNYWLFQRTALSPRVDAVARGDYHGKPADAIPTGDQPADILASALWALAEARTFEHGLERALALGGPSHAPQWRGAVYGQLAGACRGAGSIPKQWLAELPERETIETMAERLLLETASSIRHFTSWQKKPSTDRPAR